MPKHFRVGNNAKGKMFVKKNPECVTVPLNKAKKYIKMLDKSATDISDS
jgi:hypothetical protein